MTEAEFLALPERERDALVAEKVTGEPVGHMLRYYTTDIAAAWEVVEKMRGEGMYAEISVHTQSASVRFKDAEGGTLTEWADPPLAICLAALKAVGAVE